MTDTGCGIAEADRKNLFKVYFKSGDEKSRSRNGGSHGIGLSVCKQFAKSIGGDLYLNEEYSQGCEFVLRLELNKALEDKPVINTDKMHGLHRIRKPLSGL